MAARLSNMKASLLSLSVLLLPCALPAEVIAVKDTQGRTMEMTVLSYTDSTGEVKFERAGDGKVFQVELTVFDADSQKKIVENAPRPRAEILARVSVGKRRARQGDSSYMKDQTISASITVENESREIDFGPGKGTLFLVGRQTRRYSEDDADYGKVLSKQNFDISVKGGDEFTYEAKPVVTSYDSDRDSTNIGGWEYYGYLFILEDGEGGIQVVETSIGNLKKDVESDAGHARKLLGLSEGSIVEKSLEKR